MRQAMPTDTERREVARRLRSANEHSCSPDCELRYALDGSYDCKGNGCTGCHRYAFDRLADLIEPSEPKVRCVAEVKIDGERLERLAHDAVVELTGIDRDALLALADELEEDACWEVQSPGVDNCAWRLKDVCDRIREALGVTDA